MSVQDEPRDHLGRWTGSGAVVKLKWKASTAPGHFNKTGHYAAVHDNRTYNIDNVAAGRWDVSHAAALIGTSRSFSGAKKVADDHNNAEIGKQSFSHLFKK
jgi:hypothetical protein